MTQLGGAEVIGIHRDRRHTAGRMTQELRFIRGIGGHAQTAKQREREDLATALPRKIEHLEGYLKTVNVRKWFVGADVRKLEDEAELCLTKARRALAVVIEHRQPGA